jgi:hypothetical protein
MPTCIRDQTVKQGKVVNRSLRLLSLISLLVWVPSPRFHFSIGLVLLHFIHLSSVLFDLICFPSLPCLGSLFPFGLLFHSFHSFHCSSFPSSLVFACSHSHGSSRSSLCGSSCPWLVAETNVSEVDALLLSSHALLHYFRFPLLTLLHAFCFLCALCCALPPSSWAFVSVLVLVPFFTHLLSCTRKKGEKQVKASKVMGKRVR